MLRSSAINPRLSSKFKPISVTYLNKGLKSLYMGQSPKASRVQKFNFQSLKSSDIQYDYSPIIGEELSLLISQIDSDTHLQRCLNYKAYDKAMETRQKRKKIDERIDHLVVQKAQNAGSEAYRVHLAEADREGLRLRAALITATESENFSEAHRIQTDLRNLTVRVRRLRAAAASEGLATPPPVFRIGQRVRHRKYGYQALVAGHDRRCGETASWKSLRGGSEWMDCPGGYYHLLVHLDDWPSDAMAVDPKPPVAYVAEDQLTTWESDAPLSRGMTDESSSKSGIAPLSPPLPPAVEGTRNGEMYGKGEIRHPYLNRLFLGPDARGGYVPCRQLLAKFGLPRRDIHALGTSNSWEGGDDQSME